MSISSTKLISSNSEATIDVSGSVSDTKSNTNNNKLKITSPHTDHTDNKLPTNHNNRQRSRSDETERIKKAHSIDTLTFDNLKLQYMRQRKQRKRDKKHYKRMSQQLHQTITKGADDYEDELEQNELELKLDYEAKLIQAEIKQNESELKINVLVAEVQRLQQLLTLTETSSHANSSTQSLVSLCDYNYRLPATGTTLHNDFHSTHAHSYDGINELIQRSKSMEKKLKQTMSLNVNVRNGRQDNYNEYVDDNTCTGTVIVNDTDESDMDCRYSDCSDSASTTPPKRKKRKQKKNKKKVEKKTFCEFLVGCVSSNVCDLQN